jgi:hypothetical protein
LGATKPEGTDNLNIMFKCQMVLLETTDIDPLELHKELKPADNYPIFASSPMQEPYSHYMTVFPMKPSVCVE